jgi:sulfide:quinone oxidoreductase
MSPELIGQMGIGCVYDKPDYANRTWQMIDQFTDSGGVGLFTRPKGPVKCAGAPLKVTMLTEDLFERKGTRARGELYYTPPGQGLFSQPDINAFLKEEFPSRGITLRWDHPLVGIEPELKRATFATPNGQF